MIGDVRRWGSHWSALLAAVQHTRGPILELGAGWTSTPLLATVRDGRVLVTVETDLAWSKRFEELLTPGHEMVVIGGWDHDHWFYARKWGLVLVDCLPDEERPQIAERFADSATVVIVHDVQQPELWRWWRGTQRWRAKLTLGEDPQTGVLSQDDALVFTRIIDAIEAIT